MHQSAEKGRSQGVQVTFGLTNDVARYEFWCVLEHVNKPMQFFQDRIGNVTRSAGFTVQVNWNIRVFKANFLHKVIQVLKRVFDFLLAAQAEFFVVDGQNKGTGAALLLRKLGKIVITRDSQYLDALFLDGVCQGANAETRCVLGAEIFVNNDNGKTKFH